MRQPDDLQARRTGAASQANADDAALWRWLADLMEERRLVWRREENGWAVDIDGATLASGPSFDEAMRSARELFALEPPRRRCW